jgi:hypothetical protein
MKKLCAKCKDPANGSIFVEGGVSYPFCKTCTEILDSFSIPTNILHVFLKPEDKLSQVEKNGKMQKKM